MSQRSRKRAVRYVMAGKAIRDHHGNEIRPADFAREARQARIAKALELRISDQTGIGFR